LPCAAQEFHLSEPLTFDFFSPRAYVRPVAHAAPTLGREALGVIEDPEKRR
jgi:hypothetical protein